MQLTADDVLSIPEPPHLRGYETLARLRQPRRRLTGSEPNGASSRRDVVAGGTWLLSRRRPTREHVPLSLHVRIDTAAVIRPHTPPSRIRRRAEAAAPTRYRLAPAMTAPVCSIVDLGPLMDPSLREATKWRVKFLSLNSCP